MSGFDLYDIERGIFASAHAGRAAVILDHDAVLAAAPASQALGEELRSLRFGESISLGVELEAAASVSLEGEQVPSTSLSACRAEATLTGEGETTSFSCPAISVTGDGEARGSLQRSIAVALADGGLLAITAVRPEGAAGHGDEEVVGALAEPERDPSEAPASDEEGVDPPARTGPFEEALLSTEYDPGGRQRRATFELWPRAESEAPVRGAGTVICGTTLQVDEATIDVAFFRWTIEGRPGLGRYEIVKQA